MGAKAPRCVYGVVTFVCTHCYHTRLWKACEFPEHFREPETPMPSSGRETVDTPLRCGRSSKTRAPAIKRHSREGKRRKVGKERVGDTASRTADRAPTP